MEGRRVKREPSSQTPQENDSWIYSTFTKKTCSQYIPFKREVCRCRCGRLKDDHQGKALTIQATSDDIWDRSKHTETDGPTDAYGELEFTGAGQASRAKFIRISDDAKAEDVLRLFKKNWKLELPKLVISVIGGARNFDMHTKLKGLVKAAQTTDAWIITSGLNSGVTRHVGIALKKSHANLIGIASWGIVHHKLDLINRKDVVTYHMTSSLSDSSDTCIDNNHSHFILVDNGTEGKYGGEIEFRGRLEKCLAEEEIPRKYWKSPGDESHGIPVVRVVLEEGPNTILTVLESVTSNPAVPVVIAEGSGRATDILVYAYSIFTSNEALTKGSGIVDMSKVVIFNRLFKRIKNTFPEENPEFHDRIFKHVLQCVDNRQYITIFPVDEDGVDIYTTILRALRKAKSVSPPDLLDLALTSNRVDIARTEIFTGNQKWTMKTLEDAMMDALINSRVDFVILLLENGVSMSKFLTTPRLEKLYTEVPRVVFKDITGKDKIDDALQQLLEGTYKEHGNIYHRIMKAPEPVPNPYKELLLWAVLCNNQDMALLMWERGDENLARALLAAKLYNLMARRTKSDDAKADVTDKLMAHFNEFKRLSLDLLEQCFQTNEKLTQQLLTYNLAENWGEQMCLSLAFAIKHEEFMAHFSCQTVLAGLWTGGMKTLQKSSLETILGLLFPPAILLMEFRQSQPSPDPSKKQQELEHDYHHLSSNPDDNSGIELSGISASPNLYTSVTYQGTQEVSKALSPRKKFLEFYNAPATKFWANAISYMAFLVLFSFVVLVHQEKIPSKHEIVLIMFVFTLCTEEIRQILHSHPPMLKNKFKEWASNRWNILDGLAVVLFFVGLGLRLHPTTCSAGHVVYCVDVALWIVRLLAFFYVSEHMGIYVVMIGRMAADLMYFLLIMVVFFLAYGVAQQAILYPQELLSWSLVSQVFFRPYFQAHGELFMDAPDMIENRTTVFGTPRRDGHGDTVLSFMTAFYLLVVNILLINLLIAIFNNTYESVHTHANQIWKFKRYALVMEYKQRPVLVPPFIILNHLLYAIRGLYRRFRKCRLNEGNGQGDVIDKTTKGYEEKLKRFEKRCMDDYQREKDTLLHASQEEKITVIGDRMESVSSQLQKMSRVIGGRIESVSTHLHEESRFQFKSVNDRLRKLEEDLTKILANSLTPVPEIERGSSTSGPGLGPYYDKLIVSGLAPASECMRVIESREKLTTHVRARQSPYPMSSQQRYFVPDFLVAWQETFPAYDPPLYTAQNVQALPSWADADIMETSIFINFNCVEDGINRRSHTGEIDVVNQLPRNPVGRTGIAGRGLFGRWGPNHAAHLIATRWKVSKNGKIIQKQGKKVLEFLAVKSPNSAQLAMGWEVGKDEKNVLEMAQKYSSGSLEWAIPGGMVEVGDSELAAFFTDDFVTLTFTKSFMKKVLPSLKPTFSKDKKTLDERLHTIIQNAEEVYRGYVDDPRNTDNAWIETVTMTFHDETREILGDFEFEAKKDAYSVNWQEVSGHISLQANHSFILHKVAKLRDAYF